MEISDNLLCLFTAQLKEQHGSYVIEVPKEELAIGDVRASGTHRVALLPVENTAGREQDAERRESQGPPVEEGEQLTVDIVGVGEEGDGIARTGPGYVIIVPETKKGERVTIEISDVRENVGFGKVVERKAYYE